MSASIPRRTLILRAPRQASLAPIILALLAIATLGLFGFVVALWPADPAPPPPPAELAAWESAGPHDVESHTFAAGRTRSIRARWM